MKVERVEKFLAKEELNGLYLVQFECSRHWKPPVSANFEVGRFSILGNLPALDYWLYIPTAFRAAIYR